jgi:hypothetical protein
LEEVALTELKRRLDIITFQCCECSEVKSKSIEWKWTTKSKGRVLTLKVYLNGRQEFIREQNLKIEPEAPV